MAEKQRLYGAYYEGCQAICLKQKTSARALSPADV